MEREELMKLVESEMSVKDYFEIFDKHPEWTVEHIIIPYIEKHLIDREQLYGIQWALNIAEVKNDN
jgi:hypothetical protein